jgi:hypothetical protein
VAILAPALMIPACGSRLSDDHDPAPAGGGPLLPPPDDSVPAEPGLLSVVADAHAVRLTWRGLEDAGGEPVLLALFGGLDPDTIHDHAPLAVAPAGDTLVVEGVPSGVTAWFGVGLSSDGGSSWDPVGPTLSATTRAPLYVDAAASGAVTDGLTPETAFLTPLPALLTAFVQGGGNVWIAGGAYADSALPVFAGVAVAGGFAPGFVLAERDPAAFPVVLRGAPGQPVCDVQGGGAGAILDGLVLDGLGLASTGVRATDTPLEGRGLDVRQCAGPGFDLRGGENGDPLLNVLVDCQSFGHSSEGLTGHGALELQLFGLNLSSNSQEGLDLASLVAPDGRTTRLRARGCAFTGNGTEGVDIDLAAPLLGGLQGGRFELRFESCAFSGNGESGLLIDIDHEAFPGWSSDLVVRGCVTRANGADGVRLDLDGAADVLLHRLSSSCNAGDGVHVTSELVSVLPVVSASALMNNAGFGLRALGTQASVMVSGSVMAGNDAGGLLTDSPACGVVSSVAWRQPSPWPAALLHHVVVASDPAAPLFERMAVDFGAVAAAGGGSVTLGPGAPPIQPGDLLELDDDGVARTATAVVGGSVSLDPPLAAGAPRRWSRFAAGETSVVEDYDVLPGSAADDAGMAPPGGPPPDAGVFASPLGGAPGLETAPVAPLFHASRLEPPPGAPLPATQTVTTSFSDGAPDPATVSAATVRVLADGGAGEVLATTVFVQDDRLHIAPPLAGWSSSPAPLVLELHAGLASSDGLGLAAPLAIPLGVGP